jgi:hypothetical protein
MKLEILEQIFKEIQECEATYSEFIISEKRGFKGKLPELRKKLGEIKDLISKAKKETMLKK